MNARNLIESFKTPQGIFFLFLIALGIFLAATYYSTRTKEQEKAVERDRQNAQQLTGANMPQPVATSIDRTTAPALTFGPATPTPTPRPAPVVDDADPTGRTAVSKKRGPLNLFSTPTSAPTSSTGALVENTGVKNPAYAPFGRLVVCELVTTLESINTQTPLIGIVMQDLEYGGKVVIPANSEIHGVASPEAQRDRIVSVGNFRVIFPRSKDYPSGAELELSGLVLDRKLTDRGYGITDMSAGLRGRVCKSDEWAEVKMFAASLISGFAGGFEQQTNTVFGQVPVAGSFQNAGLGAAQSTLDLYAKQILDTIQRDGFYVQVQAGTQFYLYITQPVDTRYTNVAAVPTTMPGMGSGGEMDLETMQKLYLMNLIRSQQQGAQQGGSGQPVQQQPRPGSIAAPGTGGQGDQAPVRQQQILQQDLDAASAIQRAIQSGQFPQ